MLSTKADALTLAMADRLFDAATKLDSVDETVRVLMEDRFLAREIVPRLDLATTIAKARRAIAEARRTEGLARAA